MRFLADESCDFSVVRALRAAGHDVVAVAELAPRSEDSEVIRMSLRESRVLLTEDKDFGQLVYASGHANHGVLLLRYPSKARSSMPQAVRELVDQRKEELLGRFVVVEPGRIRIGPKRGE